MSRVCARGHLSILRCSGALGISRQGQGPELGGVPPHSVETGEQIRRLEVYLESHSVDSESQPRWWPLGPSVLAVLPASTWPDALGGLPVPPLLAQVPQRDWTRLSFCSRGLHPRRSDDLSFAESWEEAGFLSGEPSDVALGGGSRSVFRSSLCVKLPRRDLIREVWGMSVRPLGILEPPSLESYAWVFAIISTKI